MQTNDKDIDCNLIAGVGIKDISLNTSENKIIESLGTPSHISLYDSGRTVLYQYKFNNVGIDLFFHYVFNGAIDYVTIHTTSLVVNGIKVEHLTKQQVISFFKEYHAKNNIDFLYKFSDNQLDCSLDFYNIGVTIWFENSLVSDIEIYSPDNNDP